MLLSRVAERVYWMARYLERTENTARLINVHTSLLMDIPDEMEINWFTLVKIFNADSSYPEKLSQTDENDVMKFLIAEKKNLSSLMNSIGNVRENVRTSLDVLPEETWEQVNQLYLLIKKSAPHVSNRQHREVLLRKITMHCQCIRGVLDSHMSRDNTYHFAQIGKHIERADMTSRILETASLLLADNRSDSTRKYEGILWMTLLQALSAHQMYLKHKRPPVKSDKVLEFLIRDRLFPRSLSYSMNTIGHYLTELPNPDTVTVMQQQIADHLQKTDIMETRFHPLMDYLQEQLGTLHEEIANHWFYPDFSVQKMQEQSQSSSTQSQSQSQSTSIS
jgi:uncharacterized alpha-E superfamily protein